MNTDPAYISEKAILIRINRRYRTGMHGEELYHNTRGVWRVDVQRCNSVQFAMPVYNRIILEVYEIQSWHKAKTTDYRYREDLPKRNVPNRKEFIGKAAEEEIRNKYVDKSVAHYFNKGNQNPIFYVNC